MINLFLRTYYETDDENKAKEFADFLTSFLSDKCEPLVFKVEKYWKNPKYFEVSLDLNSVDVQYGIDAIAVQLGSGWVKDRSEYIWNPKDGNHFVAKEVTWAHLELIE